MNWVYSFGYYNKLEMVKMQWTGVGISLYAHMPFHFIPSSEFNAYLKQIKIILSAVKKYRIFSLVMNTIYIFSL